MKEFLKEVKAKFQALPTPAKAGLIVGGLVVAYLGIFRKSAETSDIGETATASEYSDMLGNIGGGAGGGGGSGTDGATALMNENVSLTAQLNDYVSKHNDYVRRSESDIEAANLAAITAQNEASLISAAASTNIYVDTLVDRNQYSKIRDNVRSLEKDNTVGKGAADKALQIVAGLGNNGEVREGADGYDPLPQTKDEIASEVERAKAVIENRKAAGLDTKEQQEYIDYITK